MKKILIIILAIFFISGCTKKDEKRTEPDKPKIESKDSMEIKHSGEAVKKNSDIENPEVRESVSDIKYGIKDIPKSVNYSGKIVASASWKDRNGYNILIITETDSKKVREEKMRGNYLEQAASYSKELYGYQYIINGETSEQVWKIQDFEKECEFDLNLDYIKNSLTITDINENGVAESVFLYQMGCMSDVSPMDYKLIMHEGKEKYAIRGTKLVVLPDIKPYGGEMKVDQSFDNAPAGFLDYAKKQWKKYQKQSYND